MSRKHCIAIAAFGLALTGLNQAHSQEVPAENEQRQTGGEQEAGERKQPIFTLSEPVEIVVIDRQAEASHAARQRAEDRQERDIAAQEGMDRATQQMVAVGWFQSFLIFVGTIALLYTLYLTRQANRAAHDTVDVTREIGRAQARSYLCVTDATIGFDNLERLKRFKTKGATIAPRISFKIKNVGSSPARDVRHSTAISVIAIIKEGAKTASHSQRSGERVDIEGAEGLQCFYEDSIAPGGEIPVGPISHGKLSDEEIAALLTIESGSWVMIQVLVQIAHRDAFNDTHVDEWAFNSKIAGGAFGGAQVMSPSYAKWFGAKFIDEDGTPHFEENDE